MSSGVSWERPKGDDKVTVSTSKLIIHFCLSCGKMHYENMECFSHHEELPSTIDRKIEIFEKVINRKIDSDKIVFSKICDQCVVGNENVLAITNPSKQPPQKKKSDCNELFGLIEVIDKPEGWHELLPGEIYLQRTRKYNDAIVCPNCGNLLVIDKCGNKCEITVLADKIRAIYQSDNLVFDTVCSHHAHHQ